MALSEMRDLRSGVVPWREEGWTIPPADTLQAGAVDIAIIGSGIMGAVLAERLSAAGHSIAMLDRRPPGMGSTAASTAEVMWAMDFPMTHLAAKLGEQEAARRWTRVYQAVRGLAERIDTLDIECARNDCPTLYLEGNILDADALAEEARLHRRHGLPSTMLSPVAVEEQFGIGGRAGIVSKGGFDVDPVRLTHGLLRIARERGARICYPLDVIALHPRDHGVELEISDGSRLLANNVILAGGYERPMLFLPPQFELLSTFVIATTPGTAPLWRGGAMIWEASDPYLYLRTDQEGRVIAGGEDIPQSDEALRDELMRSKAGTIAAGVEALLGNGPILIDRYWSATFGTSPDGLPAIGRTQTMPNVWLSLGYGGNGIAFAALAGEIIEREISGGDDPDGRCFDPYRFADECLRI